MKKRTKEYYAARYQKEKEYRKMWQRSYRLRNKEVISTKNNEYYIKHPEIKRKATLRKHKLTPEQYRKMVNSQNNVCSICGKAETLRRYGSVQNLVVDHCHKTNMNRGLLCHKCNIGLGVFDDNIDVMASAISYLKQCG